MKKILHFKKDKYDLLSRYKSIYGLGNYEQIIIKSKKSFQNNILLIIIAFLLIFVASYKSSISNQPKLVLEKDGQITALIRPGENENSSQIETEVVFQSGKEKISKTYSLSLEALNTRKDNSEEVASAETAVNKTERKINTIVSEINDNTLEKKVKLPTKLEDGTKLIWYNKGSPYKDFPMLLLALIFIIFILCKSRFDKIKKEEIAAKESIIRELPGYLNRLILLLDAGLVLQQGIIKINEDYNKINKYNGSSIEIKYTGSYFYEQISKIVNFTEESNIAVNIELQQFAKRSRVREFIRVTNIINDNINLGSDLVYKLQIESEALWFARKKQAEEKGKLAETKLTIPLVILLMVLVMITIAPALLEM
ncbi:MAG: hypothetical protein ACRCUS_02960 [Anaerovoracaceae bacterium]